MSTFARIRPVPQAKELVDICLSKTNRQTPTVIHKHFEITRIRSFYIRKIKHCAEEFTTRINNILSDFPVIEDLHPFYSEQISILYDRDTYKITLSKLNKIKIQIGKIASNSIKMIKFGDSMYRCKCLKVAGLGQMSSTVLKLKEQLSYLENVRQDFNRLPEIDISGRIIIVAGFPNVGKSSYVSAVTRCKTEVMPFAFTTKSLFVGHVLHKDLKFQLIDTPGILDKPLDERNRIEMLSISSMAHLNATILYFIDVSNSNYSVAEQIDLFNNISTLLNSNFIIVLSKMDLADKNLFTEGSLLREFLKNKKYVEISVNDKNSLNSATELICESVLKERVESKKEKALDFSHRIRVTETHDKNAPYVYVDQDENVRNDHFGTNPTFKNPCENDAYLIKDKYDIIPELMNGKNISDYFHIESIKEKYEEVLREFNEMDRKTYDIFSKEDQELLERINRARIAANMRSINSKRGFSVKGHEIAEGVLGNEIFDKPNKNTVVKNKKTQQVEGNKDVVKNPKHLFRGLSAKHARTR
ncbi:NOG1 [Ecytonucleospora hepatopenaei]|uniref:NOG1 n=1 Tax=Ecytonucleospora hepatopenaei TaxID=646526 RepID=A0A1W0E7K6_9MICR|nr:NOG1 [Ecytonucleospora hepatopenaei]